ncbi:MAG: amidohydrolase family protein, partial [Gemmatimonadota bacterium]|nr:amidohydrolase family protein [Gemmatimonadota bacterium]
MSLRRSILSLVGTALLGGSAAAQNGPMDAFRGNIAAIHARDRAAYLSHYLQSPDLGRVGPGGVQRGYAGFAEGAGGAWPDTLVATHFEIIPITPDVAYGAYRYRVVTNGVSDRGVSERVLLRTDDGWKVAVTTAFSTPGAAPSPMALVGATLIDGTGGTPTPDAVVVMRDGRIACAGPASACPIGDDVHVVQAAGKWIIPGLVDAHVHFSQTGWVDGRPDALDLRAQHPYERTAAKLRMHPERFYRSYLCSGVTSVFDVGGYPWTWDLEARTARSTTAPHVRAAGPLLSTVDFWLNLPGHRQFIHMTDEATVRDAVRAHAAWGAAAIKVWYIMPPQPPDTATMARLLMAVSDEARQAGLPLIVHATGLAGAKDAVRAGAHLLVHSVTSDPVDDEFLDLARAAGTYYTPTLTVYDGYRQVAERTVARETQPFACVDPETRAKALATDTVAQDRPPTAAQLARSRDRATRQYQQALDNLRRVHAAGIPVVMGTDAGNPLTLHGASVFMELEAMESAGMATMDVLVSATRIGARAMGLDSVGTITPGAVADLVVLEADPLVRIANVRRIGLVARAGEIYTRGEL